MAQTLAQQSINMAKDIAPTPQRWLPKRAWTGESNLTHLEGNKWKVDLTVPKDSDGVRVFRRPIKTEENWIIDNPGGMFAKKTYVGVPNGSVVVALEETDDFIRIQ